MTHFDGTTTYRADADVLYGWSDGEWLELPPRSECETPDRHGFCGCWPPVKAAS